MRPPPPRVQTVRKVMLTVTTQVVTETTRVTEELLTGINSPLTPGDVQPPAGLCGSRLLPKLCLMPPFAGWRIAGGCTTVGARRGALLHVGRGARQARPACGAAHCRARPRRARTPAPPPPPHTHTPTAPPVEHCAGEACYPPELRQRSSALPSTRTAASSSAKARAPSQVRMEDRPEDVTDGTVTPRTSRPKNPEKVRAPGLQSFGPAAQAPCRDLLCAHGAAAPQHQTCCASPERALARPHTPRRTSRGAASAQGCNRRARRGAHAHWVWEGGRQRASQGYACSVPRA